MSVLKIVTYNDQVLRDKALPITKDYPEIDTLIDDMFETMYNSNGVGLAAPQIGKSIRLFVVNADPMLDDDEPKNGEMVFINPLITKKSDYKVPMEEGCLSIPDVRDRVFRPAEVTVTYWDRNFEPKEIQADGWLARVIQHELDHLNGMLFIDYLGSFRTRLIQPTLDAILDGTHQVDYPIVPKKKSL